MYLCPAFHQTDPAAIRALIRDNPFAQRFTSCMRGMEASGIRRVTRLLACIACLLALAGPALAASLDVEIGRTGEVAAPDAGPTVPPRPGNVVGTTPVRDPKFITQGPDIEGAFCKQFGFEFRAKDIPAPLSWPVEVRLDHPLWTLPDGRTSTREVNDSAISSDRWSYSGYTLEEPFALVAGEWTFSIVSGDEVLASVSFNVSVEPGQQMPSAGCAAPTS